jgi:hypothetical protein
MINPRRLVSPQQGHVALTSAPHWLVIAFLSGAVLLFVVANHGASTATGLAAGAVHPSTPAPAAHALRVTTTKVATVAPVPSVTSAVATTGAGVLENEGRVAPKGSFDVALVKVSVTCNAAAQNLRGAFGVDLLVHAPDVIGYGEGTFPCRKSQATVDVLVKVDVDHVASKGHWFTPGTADVYGFVRMGGSGGIAVGGDACGSLRPESSPQSVGAARTLDGPGPLHARSLMRVANPGVPILMAPPRDFDSSGRRGEPTAAQQTDSCR